MTRTDRDRVDSLAAEVRSLYQANRRRGRAPATGTEYDFVCPSLATYPHQWFWDSCFHAIVLSRIDPPRAEAELATLLATQRADGFIPHLTRWEPQDEAASAYRLPGPPRPASDSMQPPILAEAVERVADRGSGADFLRAVLPQVKRYYDWCHATRDPDGDGLIAVLEPHETGMDQSPSYDAYLGVDGERPEDFERAWQRLMAANAAQGGDAQAVFALDRFVVEDVLVNVLYAENQRVLARLLAEAGDGPGSAEYDARADRTERALIARCWSTTDEDFHGLAGRAELPLPGDTIGGLMPLLLPALPEVIVARLADRLTDPGQFGTRYPVPSVSRRHAAYRSAPAGGTVLWRGPAWINTNWYLARGLRRHGRLGLAQQIEAASMELVERHGFREHYNPMTGRGYGATGFAWSALVLEMAASPLEDAPA